MCWSTYRAAYHPMSRTVRTDRRSGSRADSTTHSPTEVADVRIGDAERDDTIKALSRHTGEGRLTLDEFEERVDEVLQARTRADLRHALRELPEPVHAPARPSRPRDHRLLVRAAIVAALVVVFGWWALWLAIPLLVMRSRRWHHQHHVRHDWSHAQEDELTLV